MPAAGPGALNQPAREHHSAFLLSVRPRAYPASVSTSVKWAFGSGDTLGSFSSPALAEFPRAPFLRCCCAGVLPGETEASPVWGPEPWPNPACPASPSPEVTGSPAWHQPRQGFKWVSWGRKEEGM